MVLYLWRYVVPDPLNYTEAPSFFRCEKIIDDACSIIWCERYQEPGEIALVLRATPELLAFFWQSEIMITRDDTDRAMYVESVVLTTSAGDGDYIRITGTSAEGLTKRRVIGQRGAVTDMDATAAIRYYMQENIGSYWYFHTDDEHQHGRNNPYCRMYVNVLTSGEDDERITEKISAEPFGKNLCDFITEICKGNEFGYQITFDGEKLVYKSYRGDDRTLNQDERNAVVFSEDFLNLGNSEYEYSRNGYYSHVIAGGSGTGSTREYGESFTQFRTSRGCGLNLRQKFINASGTSGNMLRIAAQNEVLASRETINFSAEAISTGQFKYRTDYNLGDRVSVVNRYGISGTATVTEVVETEDENGLYIIPTLERFDVQEYISPVQPERPEEPVEVMVGSGTLVRTFDNYGDMNIFVGQNRDKFFYALIRKGKTVPDGAFSGLDNVTTVVFQTNVRELGEYAFSGCGLNSVDLSTVVKMGKYVFNQCDSLRGVTIPGNIKNVPEHAFDSCRYLISVQIAGGVETIGANAFRGCHELTTITINKPSGSIPGAPWGATNATVNWTE